MSSQVTIAHTLQRPLLEAERFDVMYARIAAIAMATLDVELNDRVVHLGVLKQHHISSHVTATRTCIYYIRTLT